MAISPEDSAGPARAVARIYGAAEEAILSMIARRLGRGLDSPNWIRRKADEARSVRREASKHVRQAERDAEKASREAVAEAADMGAREAASDMQQASGRSLDELREQVLQKDRLDELADATLTDATPPSRSVLRTVEDSFRRITQDSSAGALSGVETRRQSAQRALWKAADQGITRFRDSSGRNWELESWAEMSIRTATARASLDAHTRSLRELGQDLVMISDAPQECDLCRPWEGAVLSVSGTQVGTIEVPSATGGPPVTVQVDGSLDEARAAGLFHPNCRHSESAYIPGASRQPTNTQDTEGDAARQKLRQLERQVRKWKKREAAAMDEASRRQARDKVRHYQREIRDHTSNTTAKRQRQREQVSSAR
ncbi:Phage minor capsid protein 2 [Haloechinothrix alba]|uniref:Phage minor capsid protein 2 n=1 Tax=Haloechinothrix alba TaxID=664784 RepID=A0A238WCC2_9PSEU|nr:phage minor capsid protein [Haloechinothrix alba]SNR44225.1 Phage minor capsid protein 2 [Haloechinothrix alba]